MHTSTVSLSALLFRNTRHSTFNVSRSPLPISCAPRAPWQTNTRLVLVAFSTSPGGPMQREYKLVSADAHVVEPPDLWSKWMPAEFRNHADTPKLVKDEEGGDAWQFGRDAKPAPLGIYAAAGKTPEHIKWTGARYETVMPGMFQGKPRLKEQDVDGVDAEVIFGEARALGLCPRHTR